MKRIRDWRLPVRYRVPPRNDLIAFALMALAFGLMVGLAIAPGWGSAGSTAPVIALPPQQEAATATTGDTGTTTVASLQPPAGGQTTTASVPSTDDSSSTVPVVDTDDDPATDTSTDLPEDPPDTTPDDSYKEPPEEKEKPGDELEPEPALVATVVGVGDAGYAVADSSGNLLFIHFASDTAAPPKVGRKIGTGIEPLDNGTFAQSGALENQGFRTTSKLSGMVSWVDPETRAITVSSRGASIAVDVSGVFATPEELPALGQWVTGVIDFEGESPVISARSLEASGDPLTQIELAGPVTWDPALRVLTIGADGFGELETLIAVDVPKELKLKGIEDGMNYAASADLEADGTLTLAGLSANSTHKAASDQRQAFGTHAR